MEKVINIYTRARNALDALQIARREREVAIIMHIDQYTARGTLRKGRNEVLLKVCQNEQTEDWAQLWKFQARLCDATGAAVPFTQAVTEGVKP